MGTKIMQEELGIELDEDVQVNLQDYADLIPKKQKKWLTGTKWKVSCFLTTGQVYI